VKAECITRIAAKGFIETVDSFEAIHRERANRLSEHIVWRPNSSPMNVFSAGLGADSALDRIPPATIWQMLKRSIWRVDEPCPARLRDRNLLYEAFGAPWRGMVCLELSNWAGGSRFIMADTNSEAADIAAASDPGVDAVLARLRVLRPASGSFVVGVTGAVASGKSTFSRILSSRLLAWPERPNVELVCTDGFLLPNATLDVIGLTARKGFPESYDVLALRGALAEVRVGGAAFPGYSHILYDIDPALARRISAPDILIIEGLSLDIDRGADRRLLDALIYLDAEERDIESWFIDRFMGFWDAAEHDPASFYARFRGLRRDEAIAMARTVWTHVNLPNLREHIIGAREIADIVVRKRADHTIEAIELAAGGN
jgi:type I pantothenate kinase